VNRNDLTLVDANFRPLTVQISPVFGSQYANISRYILYFPVNIPALTLQTYFVTAPNMVSKTMKPTTFQPSADITLSNSVLSVVISGTTGRISNVTNKISRTNILIDQNIELYYSFGSGAYAFEPQGPSTPVSTKPPQTTVINGPFVDIIYQEFACIDSPTSYAKQTIKLYHFPNAMYNMDMESFIEITFEVGPLPAIHEIVAKFQSSINSMSFFTDNNGFEYLERQSSWTSPIASNYYPMVYASYIRDGITQLTLVGERSHGVSSTQAGELEVMIHRNPDESDGFGPALTDTDVVYPTLRVLVDSPQNSTLKVYRHSYLLNFPLTLYSAPTTSATNWAKAYKTSLQFLANALPDNIHLVSLNALDANSNKVILRLAHLFAVGEDPVYSKSVTIDLSKLLVGVKISSLVESNLTANKVINEPSSQMVTISPKEIRTFILTLTKS